MPDETITTTEASELEACERRIAAGLESFRDVCLALQTIRDDRLYRATHATFEDYCRERWGWSRQRGYQLVEAAEAIASLPAECQPWLTNERQARELSLVPPDERPEVLEKAAKSGKVTAKAIREAATPEPEPDEELPAPMDAEARQYHVSLKLKALADEVKDSIASLNPSKAELIQAALTFKKLANDLERAAAQL